ncbi:hypothetical protein [Aeromicrobium choanae]|nr:hypothetical protein [Aeromicrobium choanae]
MGQQEINEAMVAANAADEKVRQLLDKLSVIEDSSDDYESEAAWRAALDAIEFESANAQDERDEAERVFQAEIAENLGSDGDSRGTSYCCGMMYDRGEDTCRSCGEPL